MGHGRAGAIPSYNISVSDVICMGEEKLLPRRVLLIPQKLQTGGVCILSCDIHNLWGKEA